MDYRHIAVTPEPPFVEIRMRRPERRNALSEEHLREWIHAVAEVGKGPALGLILAADGPVFSAGHDFADMAGRDSPTRCAGSSRVCAELMLALQRLPQVVIAQVEGDATAAGCQLVATLRPRRRGGDGALRGARRPRRLVLHDARRRARPRGRPQARARDALHRRPDRRARRRSRGGS